MRASEGFFFTLLAVDDVRRRKINQSNLKTTHLVHHPPVARVVLDLHCALPLPEAQTVRDDGAVRVPHAGEAAAERHVERLDRLLRRW